MDLFELLVVAQAAPGDFAAALNQIVAFLSGLAVPGAILSVIVILASIIAAPIIPDWNQGIRTTIVNVLLAVVAIGFAPALVTAAAAVTGVGGGT